MDLSNINPLNPRSINTERGIERTGRSESSRGPGDSKSSAGGDSIVDEVGRSPELDQKVQALKARLDGLPDLSQERITELREQLNESRKASHQKILQAATNLLNGELFFSKPNYSG
jgi:hypothetical protein